jgi:hypothetical protein
MIVRFDVEYSTQVAGVTFRQRAITLLEGTEPLEIRPEPDNTFDKNALAVYAMIADPAMVTVTPVWVQVGYIPAPFAASVAPKLAGQTVAAKLVELTGGTAFYPTKGLVVSFEIPNTVPEQDPDQTLDLWAKHG